MGKNIIRISKEFRWEMAHALWHYTGLCKNIHGHSYVLRVVVKGQINDNKNNSKYGMVIDFGDLKKIITAKIVNIYDHSIVLNKDAFSETINSVVGEMYERIHWLPFQPTAENLVVFFANIVRENLPADITLVSVRLNETTTSFAEWVIEDNQ